MRLSIKNASQILKKLGPVVYIVGAQWGDEGKGKLVDILSEKYDITARSAGGANAGHTIWINHRKGEASKKFVFHLMPSGVLHEGKICVIGNGTVLSVPTLMEEIQTLAEQGIEVRDKLLISDRAHLVFEYHKIIDGLQEDGRDEKSKVGTTRRGIGPTYMDKVARIGLRMGDLKNFNTFASKLRANAEKHMKTYGFEFDIEREINYYRDVSEILEPYITDTSYYLSQARAAGKNILIEGAQGTSLDIDFGTYPYVTSSNTTSGGACTGLGVPPTSLSGVVGIAKAYTTRVGAGPFPTELENSEGHMLREKGGEYGATTGRPRRCGWFDAVVVKNAVRLNGINSICLTKVDVLSGFKTIKIGAGYTLDGEPLDRIPVSLEDLGRAEVVYEEMPGWNEPLTGIKSFGRLPKACKAYIEQLEKFIAAPINFIGVGMHRDEILYR
ncbi:MAG: adenylosuccinate synthase [Candidatus Peregrinibacteria bacterium]